mmetsp:Transcript_70119/g.106038  ORF Transcript_70119/g.106038 Transcript_70119/m.106038 type:complete len:509 (+) Transcript_70119:102-1628(+)
MNVLHQMPLAPFRQPVYSTRPITFKEALFSDDQPCVVVSAMEPHEVEHASSAFCELYGLQEGEMLGRTLRMVHGARTNLPLFAQKLKDATKGQKEDGLFYCYTKTCREIFVRLTAVPVVGDCGQITHVLATLAQVRDVEVAQDVTPSVEEDFWAPVEVFGSSVQKQKDIFEGEPFQPEAEFSATGLFFNAKDRPQAHAAPPQKEFVDDADAGFSAQDIFFSAKDRPQDHQPRTAEQKIFAAFQQYETPGRCGSLTERVTQLSSFKSWPEMLNAQDDTVDAQASAPAVMPVPKLQVSAPTPVNAPAPAFVQPAPFVEQHESSEGDGQTLRLFRRKKHSSDSCPSDLAGPVDISLKMLREMSDLSLKEASQKLGLSTSAMKKACRKLGVERWPIQGAKTPVIQYNSAYVRRLYCKYAKNEDDKKAPTAMASMDFGMPGSDLHGCFNVSAGGGELSTFVRAPSAHNVAMGGADWSGDGNHYFSFAGAETRAPAFEPGNWEFNFPGSMEQLL